MCKDIVQPIFLAGLELINNLVIPAVALNEQLAGGAHDDQPCGAVLPATLPVTDHQKWILKVFFV